ncbi:Lactose transport system permease protein LacF [Candidatus Calditenuaceae archaeon HR02]|nr:Lactose transport system permease protein LacF [Candidatus Calditenuaceae archaeon HR02]
MSYRQTNFLGLIFSTPFLIVFCIFVVYPLLYSAITVSSGEYLRRVMTDPLFLRSLINTIIYVGIGVNVKMMLALLLSGLLTFTQYKITRIISYVYLLPWAVPIIAGVISFRWMLQREWGIVNKFLIDVGLQPINWLGSYEGAMSALIFFHIWKWTPLWALIFYAARQGIDPTLYEAAKIDGASRVYEFIHITLPQLKYLYIFNTLLSTIWVSGEFDIPYLLTRGDPGELTHMLSILGFRYAFVLLRLREGLSLYLMVIPVLLIFIVLLLKMFGVRRS